MQHIKLFEDFGDDSEGLDITNNNSLDIDGLSLTVWYDNEHWDDDAEYENDVRFAAENMNDSLTDELCGALYPYGLTIDDSEDHDYDLEDGWVTYQLREIPDAELAQDEEGRELLRKKGYTDEEIKVIGDLGDIGVI